MSFLCQYVISSKQEHSLYPLLHLNPRHILFLSSPTLAFPTSLLYPWFKLLQYCYSTSIPIYTLITTPTPARPRKEPTKVVRLPQSICDRLIPLLADIGTDAVLALLSQNLSQSQQLQHSPDKVNSHPNLLETLSIVLSRLDALEQFVFHDNSSDAVKDSTAASSVTSSPPLNSDSKLSQEDSQDIASAQVNTTDIDEENTSEDSPAPLCGTATPDELPSFPETTRSLATRWGISPSVLTRQRQRYHDRPRLFFEYSLSKEDGLFGWFYDSQDLLFYPIIQFPDSWFVV